jgi:hypothetical protein
MQRKEIISSRANISKEPPSEIVLRAEMQQSALQLLTG